MDPKNPNHILEICKANNLETDTSPITAASWAKSVKNCKPNQRTAHLYLTFNNVEAANRAITNSLFICNKKCRVNKNRKEPIRCLKCQGWNHLAKDCNKTHDTCGNCTGHHRTCDCKSSVIKCASCNKEGHQSWSQSCPTFTKKLTELNNRNLENSTLYFPSTDPWTWSSKPAYFPNQTASKETGKQQHSSNNPRPRQQTMFAHQPSKTVKLRCNLGK